MNDEMEGDGTDDQSGILSKLLFYNSCQLLLIF